MRVFLCIIAVTSLRGSVDWNPFWDSKRACKNCHFPQGKCGLKSKKNDIHLITFDTSLPSGEVWIEIRSFVPTLRTAPGHFPQGKCGLKSVSPPQYSFMYTSLPSGEVWIEITSHMPAAAPLLGHFPQGKCGLKFSREEAEDALKESLPSGEVWIEIWKREKGKAWGVVTSLRGSVDWKYFVFMLD